MTPLPNKEELHSHLVFNATIGTIYVKDLLKIGHQYKNRLLDLWVGVLVIRAFLKVITKKSANIFESNFIARLKIHYTQECLGQALLGLDGLVL
jgi:hypothetical protein